LGGYRKGIGHQSLTKIVRAAPIYSKCCRPQLARLTASLCFFDSRTEAKQFASLAAQIQKTPEGVSAFWATSWRMFELCLRGWGMRVFIFQYFNLKTILKFPINGIVILCLFNVGFIDMNRTISKTNDHET
jgi:hypothetical protein